MKCFLKKIGSLSVSLLLLVSCFSVNSFAAAGDVFTSPAVGQQELLLNGNFETISNNTIKYWELSGGTWGASPGAMLAPGEGYDGSGNAVKLATTDQKTDVYLTHKIRTIPGATYQVSFFAKTDAMAQNAVLKFTMAFHDRNGQYLGSYNPTYSLRKSAGSGWIQYIHHFQTESDRRGISYFRLRLLGGASVVYADNVSFYAIRVPADSTEEEIEPPMQIVPDATFLPPCEGAQNLLKNSGFETLRTNGGVLNWIAYGGVWNRVTGVSVIEKSTDPTHVRTGDRAIRITNNLYETRANVTQWVHLQPGAMYQASVWVHMQEPGSAGIRYSMAYWDAAHRKNPGGYQTGAFRYKNKIGEWVQYIAQFEALEKGDNEVEFRIDLFDGDGVVCFDDASLYMIEPAKKMKFSTNELFYYTEAETGLLTAELTKATASAYENMTVDFRIKDGTSVLEEKTNASTERDDTARYIFSLSGLSIGKEYTAEAVLRDKNGDAIETQQIKFKRHLPRPKALTAEGYYKEQIQGADGKLKDKVDARGNPVYIDVMIAYTRPDDLSLLKKQGVTAYIRPVNSDVTTDNMQAELDAARKQNLKVLVGLYPNMKPAGHPENVEMSTYYVNKYKNHPAVLGWAVLDEPSAYYKERELPKLMEDSYALIRALDPVHPVYAVEATTEFLPLIGKYVDILASDPYPYNTNPIAGRTATYLRAANDAVAFGKPTVSIVQVRELNGYFPTVTEVRNMYYQALFEGTGGLGFYAFNRANGSLNLSQTDRWNGHVEFGESEQQDAFDYFVYNKYPVFCMSMEPDSTVWYAGFVRDGKIDLVILNHDEINRSAAAHEVQIPLASDGGNVRISGFDATCIYGEGEKEISDNDSIFRVSLSQNDALVYRITPNTSTDFSCLSKSTFRDLGRSPFAAEQIRSLAKDGILKGVTKTAFRPSYVETSDNFAQAVEKILGISPGTVLALAGVGTKAELTRDDMCRILLSGIDKAGMETYVAMDIATLFREHILMRHIESANRTVSRAEGAVVLERLREWKQNPSAFESEKKMIYTADGEALLAYLLQDGGTSAAGVWRHQVETENGSYLMLYNMGGERTVSVPFSNATARKVYGKGAASIADGALEIAFSEAGLCIMQLYAKAPFGIYSENVLLSAAYEGTVEVSHADETGWIAVYAVDGQKKELLLISRDTVLFTPQEGQSYELCAFDWKGGVTPVKRVVRISGATG